MKIYLLLIVFPLLTNARANPEKLNCTAKEIARQDCRLMSGSYNIRLLAKTVAWNDGTWHTVDPMPLNGEAVAWERAHFQFMNGWPILQLWLWEKGTSETQVQSLRWYVADAEKRKFTILSEGVVRRRRTEGVEPPPEEPVVIPVKGAKKAPAPVKKVVVNRGPVYIYDAWEPHGLKILKNGNLEWWISAQRKTFENKNKDQVKHGI